MSKGIIIVDMPERCSICKKLCRTDSGYAYCGYLDFDYQVNDYMESTPIGKPDWCPICPIPKKKYVHWDCANPYDTGNAEGYNACIDELMGGSDG